MAHSENLTGRYFGKWLVLQPPSVTGKSRHYLCRCECGSERLVFSPNLKNGASASCGCSIGPAAKARLTKHGMASSKLHMIWCTMRQRCGNPRSKAYPNYGGRGISVCDRWHEFAAFLEDMGPSWSDGLTIERVDVNGNYEPSNCTWVPRSEQSKNRRNAINWKFSSKPISTNTSGFRGVSMERKTGKWNASIIIDNKSIWLGAFLTKEEAARAYEQAASLRKVNEDSSNRGGLQS